MGIRSNMLVEETGASPLSRVTKTARVDASSARCSGIERKMRVVLSTWGRFHFFHLARQFERFDWLDSVITTFPRFALRKEGIAKRKLMTNPAFHPLLLLKWRWGIYNPQLDAAWLRLIVRNQQAFVARRVPNCDVFIALSGSGVIGGRLVQRRGGKWICDRSSAHLLYDNNMLAEEARRFGAEVPHSDQWLLQQDLLEYAESDMVVVPSEYARQTFLEMGCDPNRVVKIFLGSDFTVYKRNGAPDPNFLTVFYCGQVSFRKGIPYLLQAFRKLKHPQKRLIIAGAVVPEIRPYLRSVDLSGVEFVGVVGRDKLIEHYSQADVFVIASLSEGMARVQTEAMACGTPVVATFNAGATDVIDDGINGFVVPARDPDLMADRLQQLADEPQLRLAMGAKARARIETLGGWDSYGNMYRDLCLRLTGAQ